MQKLLFRATAILITLFTLLIGLVRFAGSTATPPHLFSFDPPGCYLPCIFGITPGKTTWDEYKTLIAAKVPTAQQTWGYTSDFWLNDGAGSKIEIDGHFYGNDKMQTIARLGLYNPKGQITTLGELLATGHFPVRVFRFQAFGPGGVALVFILGREQQIIASAWATGQVDLNTEIDSLDIIGYPGTLDLAMEDMDMHVDEIRWLGFASVDQYLDEPAKQ